MTIVGYFISRWETPSSQEVIDSWGHLLVAISVVERVAAVERVAIVERVLITVIASLEPHSKICLLL